MEGLWNILNTILLISQFLAALVGCIYFLKLKNNYWKWFSLYLILIFLQEFFWIKTSFFSQEIKQQYYLLIGMPLEFLFLFWLYALKSLKKKNLHKLFTFIFIVSLSLIAYNNDRTSNAYSLVLNIGTFLLIILVIIEFIKQINNDDILKFKENKMFYINLGVVLFYFGSFPFHVFQKYLYKDYTLFVEYYYIYFLISNCIMYLLFAASFIWGKEQS